MWFPFSLSTQKNNISLRNHVVCTCLADLCSDPLLLRHQKPTKNKSQPEWST